MILTPRTHRARMRTAKVKISSAKTRASASAPTVSPAEDFDLFCSDYATNETLDRYSDTGIDDAQEFEGMTGAQRRAAERAMAQRDMQERGSRRGARAAARSRGPDFLLSDGLEEEDDMDGGLLSGMKRRTRRQYDERRDMDDLDGIEDVGLALRVVSIRPLISILPQELPMEQLGDIKAKSIVEWIVTERVRRSIVRHFRNFLVSYVDQHGNSVYGERIRNLGESEYHDRPARAGALTVSLQITLNRSRSHMCTWLIRNRSWPISSQTRQRICSRSLTKWPSPSF